MYLTAEQKAKLVHEIKCCMQTSGMHLPLCSDFDTPHEHSQQIIAAAKNYGIKVNGIHSPKNEVLEKMLDNLSSAYAAEEKTLTAQRQAEKTQEYRDNKLRILNDRLKQRDVFDAAVVGRCDAVLQHLQNNQDDNDDKKKGTKHKGSKSLFSFPS